MNQTEGVRKKTQNLGNTSEEKENINVSVSVIDKLKDELDDFIASDCIFCGDIMIKSIAEPFIGTDEYSAIASWTIST
jgi:hypothetical protein